MEYHSTFKSNRELTIAWIRASLVAQMVKNPPVMWETWVRSLGLEDPLEKGTAIYSSILAWRITWMGSLASSSPWVCKESDVTEQLSLTKLTWIWKYFFEWVSECRWKNVIINSTWFHVYKTLKKKKQPMMRESSSVVAWIWREELRFGKGLPRSIKKLLWVM